MATDKRVFTLRLSNEVFDKIGVLATIEHRSLKCGAVFAQPQYSTDNALGVAILAHRALEREVRE